MKNRISVKKIKKAGLALLAAAVFSAASGFAGLAAAGGSPEVYMEVSSVYGSVGRMGSHVPVTVELYGQSPSPFEGTVCIESLESREGQGSEVYEYQYPVSVATGETKTFQFYVPLGQKSNELLVILRAEDGSETARGKLAFELPKDTGSLLAGVLSDDCESIQYLDGVSLNYGMVRSFLLELDASSFPADARGLDLLDVLLINDFDTSSLSKEQQEAIWRWVKEGGILVFGTGERVADTLGPFTEELVEIPYEAPRMESINMGAEYAEYSPEDAVVEAVCADLSIPGGEELMTSDEQTILTMVARGSGQVGIFSVDLGDLEEFARKNPSYMENMFVSILGEDRVRELYFYSSYGDDSEYWNAQSLVNTGNAERLPDLGLYGLVIAAYIVIAGPGIYLILKKRDARRYYGTVLVLFAFLSSAAVYVLGERTRFRSEFFTYASIRDVGEEGTEEISYLNIRTPDRRSYSVDFTPEYQVTPVTRTARYDDEPAQTMDGAGEGNLTVEYGEEKTTVTAKGSQAFEPRFFRLTRQAENGNGQGIAADLSYFEGEITGTVTNHFSFPLERTALLFYGQAVFIGRLEPGETRSLDGSRILTYPAGMTYILASKLSGNDAFNGADVDDQEYLLSLERTSLYSFYLSKYYGTYTPEARIAAFGPEDGLEAAFEGKGQEADGLILYTSQVEVDMERNGRLYRSGLLRSPKVTTGSGSYYSDYTTIYGNEQMILEYYLGSDLEIEQVFFLPLSEEFLENSQYYYIRRFDGAAYFYNYNTKAYDQVDLTKERFSAEELRAYLSPSNSLTVKYVNGDGDPGSSASLPLLMVTGRER